jgi:hypothetical protein
MKKGDLLGAGEAEDVLAGNHSAVDEDRLQTLVAAVDHRIQHLLTIHHITNTGHRLSLQNYNVTRYRYGI